MTLMLLVQSIYLIIISPGHSQAPSRDKFFTSFASYGATSNNLNRNTTDLLVRENSFKGIFEDPKTLSLLCLQNSGIMWLHAFGLTHTIIREENEGLFSDEEASCRKSHLSTKDSEEEMHKLRLVSSLLPF